jgi:hypothetical protein
VILQWRQSLLLGRTFFGRLFESELMPAGLPQVQLLIGAIVLLGTPPMLVPLTRSSKYAYLWFFPGTLAQAIATDRVLLITLSMISMGFLGLVIWEGVFPDRRDARILSVLPLRTTTFVIARLGALGWLFCLFVAGTFVLPAVFFGVVASSFGSPGGMVRGIGAQFVAMSMAAACGFFALIALQCALLTVLGRATVQRVSVALQILFAVGLLQMLLFVPHVGGLMRDGNLGPDWLSSPMARRLPPVWFLGVYEVLSGFGGRGAYNLATMAVLVTSGSLCGAVVLYAASYRRLTRRALETDGNARAGVIGSRLGDPARWIVGQSPRWLAGSHVERAVCAFTLRTLVRSRQHRMLLSIYAAVALALIGGAVLPFILRHNMAAFARPRVALLSAPLVMMFLILAGMRGLFAIPVERKANWVIRLREPADRRAAINGVRRAMVLFCVIPVVVLGTVGTGALCGTRVALQHGWICTLMGVGLTELLLVGLWKIPFTCTYFPGKARVRTLWPAYFVAFTTYAYTVASLEAVILLRHSRAFVIFSILVCSIIAGLTAWRTRRLAEIPGLMFEEEDPDALFGGFSLSESLAARHRTTSIYEPTADR